MRQLLIPCVVLAALLSGCRSKDAEIYLSNVSAEEIISVSKPRDLGAVTHLRLRVDGKIEGAAQLILLQEGKPYHVENLSGTVDAKWSGDWYDDRARLHYVPGPNTSGTLRLRYRFFD